MDDIKDIAPVLIVHKSDQAVNLDDGYYVCKFRDGKWCMVESQPSESRAFKARGILANHDLTHGHIKDDRDYRVFKKGLNHIEVV